MHIGAFLDLYDKLTTDDLRTCLTYCASKQCVADSVLNYCQGCSLDKRPPAPHMRSADKVFSGSVRQVDEPTDEEEPHDGWKFAERALHEFEWYLQ